MPKMIEGVNSSAYLEYAIWIGYNLVACSLFNRSNQQVRSVTASLAGHNSFVFYEKNRKQTKTGISRDDVASTFIFPMRIGKERVSHGFLISDVLGKSAILTTKERLHTDVYNFLMKNFKLPLEPEWTDAILEEMEDRGYASKEIQIVRGYEDKEFMFPLGNKQVKLGELIGYSFYMKEERFESMISLMLKNKRIEISKNIQEKLHFENMDEYFKEYGSGVMENLKHQLTPVSEHTDTMQYTALKKLRLYPQQISIDMGVTNYFRKKKGHYAILNCGMGTGKTIMGAAEVDAYFNSIAMDRYHMTLPEVLKNKDLVSYRNIVMSPSHLVEKWVAEINNQIPHAKAIALTDFSQLIEIKKAGKQRNGKEVYVMSKDFGKLSYMDMPAVTQLKKKKVKECRCNLCDALKPVSYKGRQCQNEACGGEYIAVDSDIVAGKKVGFICPSCGELLCTPPKAMGEEFRATLGKFDFSDHTASNDHCWFCDEPLWQPYVKNIGNDGEKKVRWHRMTHYANKAHKGKKTVWLFKGSEGTYFSNIGESPLADLGGEGGCRKYAPASYIKKQLKGFFDFAIFDEIHQYKASGSAQGNAMGALVKASKFQLGLTGTIAGGYATHLFSLLFRLEPSRMIAKGFSYNSDFAFAEQYGTVERQFEAVESYRSNKMSKGRQTASPKVKPGISPKVFTDFLMDRAVFLDLSDMSRFLPPLKEKVVLVDTEYEIACEYRRVVDLLKERAKEKGGFGLMSSMLQFSLSYVDKPYGVNPIVNPLDGSLVCEPANLSFLVDDGRLLNKERELVNIINKEQAEGRNVVVYAEYTNSEETCVTERLKDIIEKNCGLYGQVQIIKSATPAAIKREAWLHKKASEGIKVFITNPKILETGVDLCFKHKDVSYNYPTLIFYQMGYSLFTIWQASRRHYRLNQREECRTYYLASKDSVQPAVIRLIAAKQVATAAIQGKFSSEGLSAMAEGVDVRLQLAKALADNDKEHEDELQGMFDVLASDNGEDLGDFTPMPTYYELVGEEEPEKEAPYIPDFNEFAMNVLKEAEPSFFGFDLFSDLGFDNSQDKGECLTPIKEEGNVNDDKFDLPKTKKGACECFSLFDFV